MQSCFVFKLFRNFLKRCHFSRENVSLKGQRHKIFGLMAYFNKKNLHGLENFFVFAIKIAKFA